MRIIETICLNCQRRKISCQPDDVVLRHLTCGKCHSVGHIIDTGQKYFDPDDPKVKKVLNFINHKRQYEIKDNINLAMDNSLAEQQVNNMNMYEEAYKKTYECFLGWLEKFNQMKPDKDFSEDRIFGMKNATENVLAEMESYNPDLKVIREDYRLEVNNESGN